MDITLERIFSLVERKPNGDFAHGAKKRFCESIGAPPNIMSAWECGKNHSYRNYLYQIASVYDVSLEWLRGETDIIKPVTTSSPFDLSAIFALTDRKLLLEIVECATKRLRELEG